jgi:hypothetical protein
MERRMDEAAKRQKHHINYFVIKDTFKTRNYSPFPEEAKNEQMRFFAAALAAVSFAFSSLSLRGSSHCLTFTG